MGDATLRSLSVLRAGADPRPGVSLREAVEAFACLLLEERGGCDDLARSLARSAAVRASAQSAPSAAMRRAHPFAVAYRAVTGARGIGTREPVPRGALALEGLTGLPRPQRAMLALSCVLGFTDEELGYVLGLSAAAARATLDDALRAVRAASVAAPSARARGSDAA